MTFAIVFTTVCIHLIISFQILIAFESNYTSGVPIKYIILCFIPIVNIIVYINYKLKRGGKM